MKYRVTGQNRDTGARQTLEFEAESKGAAERKAQQTGMTVNRVELVNDEGGVETALETRSSIKRGTGGNLKWGLLLVVCVVVIALLKWPRIKAVLGL